MNVKEGTHFHDPTLYRSIMGMLQYFIFTKPDIIYFVNQVSRFMYAPTNIHMETVKRILQYLKVLLEMV